VRHTARLAVEIINDLCVQPLVLLEWHFSQEYCATTVLLIGASTGFVSVQSCPQTLASSSADFASSAS
jgi:hypothetical protein